MTGAKYTIVTLLLAVAALATSSSTTFAAKGPSGEYTLTFYIDPAGSYGSTYCLVFTQSGADKPFPVSGTVNDTIGFLTGEYQLDETLYGNTTLRMEISDTIKNEAVGFIGNFRISGSSGNWDDFFIGSAPRYGAIGSYTLVPGCTDETRNREHSGSILGRDN